jgi:ribosomal protein S18 acetylase RimI-like enzyme
MIITAVEPAELSEAFALLYGPGTSEDVGHAFRMVARGELDTNDVLVARRDGALIGAVFASRLPGGVAVIWPPRTVGDDAPVEDALTAAAMQHVGGVKAVQAFLPPEEIGRSGPLLRAGFCQVTRVWQMSGLLAATRERTASPGAFGDMDLAPWGGEVTRSADGLRLTAISYPGCDSSTFDSTLLRAHDDSLDCPELHRVLTPDDVLAGYRDTAPDPEGWWLAVADGEPVGVLLLSNDELTFLGVVPERRGQGIGRQLLEIAFERSPQLTLIVDARNTHANHLYRSAGLDVVGAREVFLYFPAPAAGIVNSNVRRS